MHDIKEFASRTKETILISLPNYVGGMPFLDEQKGRKSVAAHITPKRETHRHSFEPKLQLSKILVHSNIKRDDIR